MATANPFWGGKSVFVTGGTGFVGGCLVRELLACGSNVTVLSRPGSTAAALLHGHGNGNLVRISGEVEDFAVVRSALAECRPAFAFHLAGQPAAGAAKKDPLKTLETNVRGTWNVLEAARQVGGARVIVASSDKAYGESSELPHRETDPLRASFPYDVSKSCADSIAGMYATSYCQRVSITRFANVFGGGDLNYSRLIPGLIRSTLRGERFVIHSDGLFVRDFLYVGDAVQALLLLAERLDSDASLVGQAFNFALGIRITVLELVEKILVLMGAENLRPIIKNEASCETRESHLCCDKAKEWLGWRPRYSLEEGLRHTIAWYQDSVGAEARSVMEAAG